MPTRNIPMPPEPPADAMENETENEVEAQRPMAGGHEVCVPMSALAMPDESEVLEPPAVGDAVQFNCEGKVSRIEGDKAYVSLSAVNGQEMPKPEAAPEPTEESELAGLEAEAMQQPDRYA